MFKNNNNSLLSLNTHWNIMECSHNKHIFGNYSMDAQYFSNISVVFQFSDFLFIISVSVIYLGVHVNLLNF